MPYVTNHGKQQTCNGEKLEKFRQIASGIAAKYASKWVSREDLEQELWVKILELGCYHGLDNMDAPFVARCCFNAAVDFYRKSRRIYESKRQWIEEEGLDDVEAFETKLHRCSFRSGFDEIQIHEVINLFQVGSRERKYVLLKLMMWGEIPISEVLDELGDDAKLMPDADTEAEYLQLLGYKSHWPASWGKKKWFMRQMVNEYFGREVDPEYIEWKSRL